MKKVESIPVAFVANLKPNPSIQPALPLHTASTLVKFGTGLEISGTYDNQTRDVVQAFQRHWTPEKVDGIADQSTLTTIKKLLN
jgi:N-acetylmuramoyl-L-alanine amidase